MNIYTDEQYAIYEECVIKLTDNGLFPIGVLTKQEIQERYGVILTTEQFFAVYAEFTQLYMDELEDQALEEMAGEVEVNAYPQLINN